MVFVTPNLRLQERMPDYQYCLPVPGRASVPELGLVIEALRVTPESQIAEYNPQQLLGAELLPRQLIVRNWRPGDRFWPAHTKAPKKVKELLQERQVTNPVRTALAGRNGLGRDRVDAQFSSPREVAFKIWRASCADPGVAVGG